MYERPRQRANVQMMAALDSLHRVFLPQEGPLASLRGLGLGLINASSMLKQPIMRFAFGG